MNEKILTVAEEKKEYVPARADFIPLEMNENIAISGWWETDAEGNEYFVNPNDEDRFNRG